MMMKRKGFGRKQSWPITGTPPAIPGGNKNQEYL
jgi:hypothetical protein